MHSIVIEIQNYRKWLILSFAMLMGIFAASSMPGQEIVGSLESSSILVDPQLVVETDENMLQPIDSATGSLLPGKPLDLVSTAEAEPQRVLTKDKCPHNRLVEVSSRDQVWFVCSREAHCYPGEISTVQFATLANSQWHTESMSKLTSDHENQKDLVTFVYVHGNRTDEQWAKSRGLQVYQQLFGEGCPTTTRPPVRFIIFSWKSEKENFRLFKDYKIKSDRAPMVGQTFGAFLNQFSDRNIVLCGFSLGSQVLLSGLAGNANCTGEYAGTNSRYKVALLAPALNPDYVCSELRHLTSNQLIEKTQVFFSRTDRAIRAAEKIAKRRCQAWIPVFQDLSRQFQSVNPVTTSDITDQAKKHAATTYAGSPSVRRCLNQFVQEVAERNLIATKN